MIVDLEGTILYVTKNITEQAGPHSVSLRGIKVLFDGDYEVRTCVCMYVVAKVYTIVLVQWDLPNVATEGDLISCCLHF